MKQAVSYYPSFVAYNDAYNTNLAIPGHFLFIFVFFVQKSILVVSKIHTRIVSDEPFFTMTQKNIYLECVPA